MAGTFFRAFTSRSSPFLLKLWVHYLRQSWNMLVCLYICMYVCMHVHVCMYANMHVYMYIFTYESLCAFMRVWSQNASQIWKISFGYSRLKRTQHKLLKVIAGFRNLNYNISLQRVDLRDLHAWRQYNNNYILS